MGSAAFFSLVPTRELIEIVKRSDDIVEDVLESFHVGYNLSESPEDDEKFALMKSIIYSVLPRYFSRDTIALDGLGTISEMITDAINDQFDEDISDPLITDHGGYFDRVITSTSAQFFFTVKLVGEYFPSQKFPVEIDGVTITHSEKCARMIFWKDLARHPIGADQQP